MGIVILSIIGIFLEEMKSGFININPTIIRVMRVLRIARGKLSYYQFYSQCCNSAICMVIITGPLKLLLCNFSYNW